MGINADTLRGWTKQAQIDAGGRPGLSTSDRRRLAELERKGPGAAQSERDLEGGVVLLRGGARPPLRAADPTLQQSRSVGRVVARRLPGRGEITRRVPPSSTKSGAHRQAAAHASDYHRSHPQCDDLAVAHEPDHPVVTAVEVHNHEPTCRRRQEQDRPQPTCATLTTLDRFHGSVTGPALG